MFFCEEIMRNSIFSQEILRHFIVLHLHKPHHAKFTAKGLQGGGLEGGLSLLTEYYDVSGRVITIPRLPTCAGVKSYGNNPSNFCEAFFLVINATANFVYSTLSSSAALH